MDSSYEEIEESMQELVQRAEAFLSAYPCSSSSGSSSGSSGRPSTGSSSSGSSSYNSSRTEEDSFTTAGESSMSSISLTDEAPPDVSGSGREVLYSTVSSDSSEDSRSLDMTGASSSANSSVVSASMLERTNSEDCVVVPFVPHVIDLCSPRVQRLLVRRIANAAPIVDSITLDDTINENPAPPPEVPEPAPQLFRPPELPQPVEVVNEYLEEGPPPAKRSKEGSVPSLNLSLSSDGGSQEPAVAVSCPICFDSIFRKQASSTICGHLFCHACISQEIQLRKQCPLCKRKLARNHIHPIYFN